MQGLHEVYDPASVDDQSSRAWRVWGCIVALSVSISWMIAQVEKRSSSLPLPAVSPSEAASVSEAFLMQLVPFFTELVEITSSLFNLPV